MKPDRDLRRAGYVARRARWSTRPGETAQRVRPRQRAACPCGPRGSARRVASIAAAELAPEPALLDVSLVGLREPAEPARARAHLPSPWIARSARRTTSRTMIRPSRSGRASPSRPAGWNGNSGETDPRCAIAPADRERASPVPLGTTEALRAGRTRASATRGEHVDLRPSEPPHLPDLGTTLRVRSARPLPVRPHPPSRIPSRSPGGESVRTAARSRRARPRVGSRAARRHPPCTSGHPIGRN